MSNAESIWGGGSFFWQFCGGEVREWGNEVLQGGQNKITPLTPTRQTKKHKWNK